MQKLSSSLGLRTLARHEKLTDADWLQLIEDRRKKIKPHLHDMTVREIGKVHLIDDYPIASYHPKVIGSNTLETRCIVDKSGCNWRPKACIKHTNDTTIPGNVVRTSTTFWGLTRSAIWISIELITETSDTIDYKNRRARKKKGISLTTEEWSSPADLFNLIGQTPQSVWFSLGQEIRDWHERRLNLLATSEMLVKVVEFEEELSHIINQ